MRTVNLPAFIKAEGMISQHDLLVESKTEQFTRQWRCQSLQSRTAHGLRSVYGPQ